MSQLIVDLHTTGSLAVPFDLSAEDQEYIEGLQGERLWKRLEEAGRTDVVNDMVYRQVSSAVISDATSFICESLLACAKGKIAVAYSFFRKPMKENLLLLDWLCGDPEGFLSSFNGESDMLLDPGSRSASFDGEQLACNTLSNGRSGWQPDQLIWSDERNPELHELSSVRTEYAETGASRYVAAVSRSWDVDWDKFRRGGVDYLKSE